jgi:allantoicase
MDFTELPDLAAARVGGRAVLANDEFFAPKRNLLQPGRGVFIAGKFTSRGKWMDGWETRRRRTPGHDWCIVQLGLRGVIRGIDVDTNHFIGNYPEHASLDACDLGGTPTREALLRAPWTEVLPKSPLAPGSRNLLAVRAPHPCTHVRLAIHPDGGVARLRVHGEVDVDPLRLVAARRSVDLVAIENGGQVLAVSDEHFGSKDNMIMPGRAPNMGDGWETRRRRGPGHDWAILKMGVPGDIERIEVDTNHFKGNYPDSCSLEGCLAPGATLDALRGPALHWDEVLPATKLRASHRHLFSKEIQARGPFTHLRLRIFPDGGVSRLRIHGRPRLA